MKMIQDSKRPANGGLGTEAIAICSRCRKELEYMAWDTTGHHHWTMPKGWRRLNRCYYLQTSKPGKIAEDWAFEIVCPECLERLGI